MFTFAKRTQVFQSTIREIFSQVPIVNAQRRTAGLSEVIDLSIGQPHLAYNPVVHQGLQHFFQSPEVDAVSNYSPAAGRPETLQAIVSLYNLYYPQISYTENEVMITNGASQGIYNALSIFLEQGDNVLVFEPYFSTYRCQVETLGGNLIGINTLDQGLRPTAAGLEAALSNNNAKILILNYPNNPSGVAFTKDEVCQIAEIIKKHAELIIILDDVYRELSYVEHITILDVAPELKNRTVAINSGSKGLIGAPDLRIGIVAAPSTWISKMASQQLWAISGVNFISQKALCIAVQAKLTDNAEYLAWLKLCRQIYQSNVMYIMQNLNAINLPPVVSSESGFFVMIDASSLIGKKIPNQISFLDKDKMQKIDDLHRKVNNEIFDDTDITKYFLHIAGVAVVPGSGFGLSADKGYLRLACAKNSDILVEAIARIKQAVGILEFNQAKSNRIEAQSIIKHSPLFADVEQATNKAQDPTLVHASDLLTYTPKIKQ